MHTMYDAISIYILMKIEVGSLNVRLEVSSHGNVNKIDYTNISVLKILNIDLDKITIIGVKVRNCCLQNYF